MDFQQEYIEEVRQILKDLEKSLMQLDENPDHADEIANVYRYLHTLKGSAGMFGFHQIEKLTHELEYLYSDVRDGIRTHDEQIMDLTLHSVDVLADLIEGQPADDEVERIIRTVLAMRDTPASPSGGTLTPDTEDKQLPQAVIIFFTPDSNIFKRGINLNAILDDIRELGQGEVIVHNELVPLEKQLESKELTSWFEVLLVPEQDMEEIRDVFMFLGENEYEILELTSPEQFMAEPYTRRISLSEEQINDRINTLKAWSPQLFEAGVEEIIEEPTAGKAVALKASAESQEDEETFTFETQKSKKNKGNISVATPKLDQLINIVSELVTFRSELQHLMSDNRNTKVVEAMEKLDFLTLRLRDSAFNIRLVPLSILQVKLQRLIRSVSKELNKEVEFITEGLDTELDRSIINALEAPLMHIIRNAMDHGIEQPEERMKRNKPEKGLLKLYSYNSGDHVFIQVQDDGNGIDFDKIREKGIAKGLLNAQQNYSEKELINVMMSPGFSTASAVTTVSGRGVGMDIVKREVNALRGDVEISSEKGLGTIITLRLPLTLTILDTLVVRVADQKYLIPVSEVEYCYEEQHANLFSKKSRHIRYEKQLIPFFSLREYFEREEHPEKETVIVVNKNDTRVAVVVDGIAGQYQTVYKPLNELLQPVDCFSGASILGDGSTALILNALKLKN